MSATKLEIGTKAPQFSLKNQDGASVSLSDFEFRGRHGAPCVAEVFYSC